MLRYSEPELVRNIERLSNRARVSFATACAQRMFPAYVDYGVKTRKGDPGLVAKILARLWRDIIEERISEAEVHHNITQCMELIARDDEQPWVIQTAAAQNAVSAVAYALRCQKTYQAQEAGWAARMAYEALDDYVISQEEIDTNEPGAEAKLLSHPLIQAELARQQRDLDELLAGKVTPLQLHQRAIAESATYLPVG